MARERFSGLSKATLLRSIFFLFLQQSMSCDIITDYYACPFIWRATVYFLTFRNMANSHNGTHSAVRLHRINTFASWFESSRTCHNRFACFTDVLKQNQASTVIDQKNSGVNWKKSGWKCARVKSIYLFILYVWLSSKLIEYKSYLPHCLFLYWRLLHILAFLFSHEKSIFTDYLWTCLRNFGFRGNQSSFRRHSGQFQADIVILV